MNQSFFYYFSSPYVKIKKTTTTNKLVENFKSFFKFSLCRNQQAKKKGRDTRYGISDENKNTYATNKELNRMNKGFLSSVIWVLCVSPSTRHFWSLVCTAPYNITAAGFSSQATLPQIPFKQPAFLSLVFSEVWRYDRVIEREVKQGH